MTDSPINQFGANVSPDGTRIVFEQSAAGNLMQLWVLTLDDGRVEPLLGTSFEEKNPRISPDGRWLAYESDESGQFEIYVRHFPDVARQRYPVSNGGGTRPLWTQGGRELLYESPTRQLMSVEVEPTSSWQAGKPTALFDASDFWSAPYTTPPTYDVSADGTRFLVIKLIAPSDSQSTTASIVIVSNWFEELRSLP